jgi:hypothetical protein
MTTTQQKHKRKTTQAFETRESFEIVPTKTKAIFVRIFTRWEDKPNANDNMMD